MRKKMYGVQVPPADLPCLTCGRAAPTLSADLRARNAAIAVRATPLPGSIPHDNYRPFRITAAVAGRGLLDALCALFPHVPPSQWQQSFSAGRILHANKSQATPTIPVRAGERYLHWHPAQTEPAVNPNIAVMYEDEALVIINKPAPLPMHASGRYERNTVMHLLQDVFASPLRLVHRLDGNTTGVVVLAKSHAAARDLQAQFERGMVHKRYLARVHGHPPVDNFDCEAPLSANSQIAGSRAVVAQGGLAAATRFQVLQRFADGTSLVAVYPKTGRTNQIRVHAWHLGYPLCGDPTYRQGGVVANAQTLDVHAPPMCLHAHELEFAHPANHEPMTAHAAAPAWAADGSLQVGHSTVT